MTIVTITLMAFAALIAGRTFGVQLRASIQERLIIEDRLTARNAERIMDAWMADPVFSTAITDNDEGAGQWRTPEGSLGCSPPTDSTCWQFTTTDPTTTNPQLRGGEAEQDIRDIIIEIRSGCFNRIEHCQRTSETTRTYERAVFTHYQLHYENDIAPDAAFNDPMFTGPDGIPDDTACETPPVPPGTVCDDPPEAQLRGLRVVFTSDDTLNGPLRYSGNDEVRYCGSPTFKLIESKSSNRPSRAEASCPSRPSWQMDDGTTRQWPISHTDPLDADRFVVKGDELDLPTISAPQQGCLLTTVSYSDTYDITDKNGREANPGDCPGEPGQNVIPHAILDGDIITSTGSVTIKRLVVEGSVTVYAEGDIIICGNIEASGTNPAGGPNVIALITEGDVILDPSSSTPPECADDTLPELNASHSLTLTNVAILAPEGAVYARRWHLPHAAGGGPTLIIEGSIAATHLGLYGIPSLSGGVTNGWSKQFSYPQDFWRARPPWWPDFAASEWVPVAASAAAPAIPDQPPQPGLTVNPVFVTVTEGTRGESFDVALESQPSADVTVTVRQAPTVRLLTTPTVTFTPDDWDAVTVDVSASDDPDTTSEQITVTLTTASADSDYDGLTEEVQVTVLDNDIGPALVVDVASLNVDENDSDTFTISLATAPSDPVSVSLASDDIAAATVLPATLTFAASNYDTAQPVTVTGVDDDDASDESSAVTLVSASPDSLYDGLTVSVVVGVTDDDEPGLVLSESLLTVIVNEHGTTNFDVSLATVPSGTVTVSVSSADTSVATVSPATLTFTTIDWSSPQSVTVAGTDDDDFDDEDTSITLSAANGGYDTVIAQIAVTVTDDDTSRFGSTDASAYVATRDALVDEAHGYRFLYGQRYYVSNYQSSAQHHRSQHNLHADIPLGEDDPASLPNPENKQTLKEAIDALAVAAGLPQSMIDTAEGG